MKVVKKSKEYTVYQKRSGRYAVKGADSEWINEDEKIKVLLAEGLIVVPEPKAAEPEATGDEEGEAEVEEATEAEDSAKKDE